MYCPSCMGEIKPEYKMCPHCGGAIAVQTSAHHLLPGTVLADRYLLGTVIGEGGFGITYVGRDMKLGMKVAVKEYFPNGYVNRSNIVSTEVTHNVSEAHKEFFEAGKGRFLREAQVLAGFADEPGVVEIRDFFEVNNTAYIVMEYLEGEDLKTYVAKRGTISPGQTLELLLPVMRTLTKIHSHDLIHRDISPDNIRITDKGMKLLDFGAARTVSAMAGKSLSVMLKPGYAPEEQYRSKGEQGPWTDVYALCATMYKCITGITPVDSTQRLFSDELEPPSKLGINIGSAFENTLMRGLAVLKRDRIGTMEELIDGFLGKSAVAPPPPAPFSAPLEKTVFVTPPPARAEDAEVPSDTELPAELQEQTDEGEAVEDASAPMPLKRGIGFRIVTVAVLVAVLCAAIIPSAVLLFGSKEKNVGSDIPSVLVPETAPSMIHVDLGEESVPSVEDEPEVNKFAAGTKSVTCRELTMTISDQLTYIQRDGLDACFVHEDGVIAVVGRFDTEELSILAEMDLEEFAEYRRLNDESAVFAALTEGDGFLYDTCTDAGSTILNAYFKSDKACWIVVMACDTEDFSEMKPIFLQWASSVSFDS